MAMPFRYGTPYETSRALGERGSFFSRVFDCFDLIYPLDTLPEASPHNLRHPGMSNPGGR